MNCLSTQRWFWPHSSWGDKIVRSFEEELRHLHWLPDWTIWYLEVKVDWVWEARLPSWPKPFASLLVQALHGASEICGSRWQPTYSLINNVFSIHRENLLQGLVFLRELKFRQCVWEEVVERHGDVRFPLLLEGRQMASKLRVAGCLLQWWCQCWWEISWQRNATRTWRTWRDWRI